MAKNRKTPTRTTPGNELEALLDGIDAAPEGVLAHDGLANLEAHTEELAEHDALLESLEAEALREDMEFLGTELDEAPSPPLVVVEADPDAIVITIDKAALYADQGAGSNIPDEADLETAPAPEKKARAKASTDKAPKTPRVKLAPDATRSATLMAKGNIADLEKIGVPEDQIPAIVAVIDDMPKKVAEKAFNLLRFMLGREALSGYTKFALKALNEGPLKVPELVALMEKQGWSPATSRSQAQQMSRLFKAYGMVDTSGGYLTLNRDAPFVKHAMERLA
jgi:hypothetical protein